MRRWFVVSVIVCGVLGAMTSVGVAWGLIAAGHTRLGAIQRAEVGFVRDVDEPAWGWTYGVFRGAAGAESYRLMRRKRSDWPGIERGLANSGVPTATHESGASLPSWVEFRPDEAWRESRSYAVGWPLPAMSFSFEIRYESGDTPSSNRHAYQNGMRRRCVGLRGAWAISDDESLMDRALPYRPHWPGFLVDSAMYGAAWYLIVPMFGWRAVRTEWRRHGGRCPRCGYDLRGTPSGGCAECGQGREGL